MQTEVLTDTVEHHHRVVDIITDHRQDSTDERLVYLEREAYPAVAQREEANDHRRIDSQSHDRTDREADVAEAEQDIKEDTEECQTDTIDCVSRDILSHRRTDLRRTDDRTTLTDVGFLKASTLA